MTHAAGGTRKGRGDSRGAAAKQRRGAGRLSSGQHARLLQEEVLVFPHEGEGKRTGRKGGRSKHLPKKTLLITGFACMGQGSGGAFMDGFLNVPQAVQCHGC